MSEPFPWEIPFIERLELINQEIQIVTLVDDGDGEHRGEWFCAYEIEPSLEAVREMNTRLREKGAQVIEIDWTGGYDEDLDEVGGPGWDLAVLLMGDATDEDIIQVGEEVGLDLSALDIGFFRRRDGMVA